MLPKPKTEREEREGQGHQLRRSRRVFGLRPKGGDPGGV